MGGIVAVVPSRGRPAKAARAIDALRRRASLVSTSIALVVDADDSRLSAYQRLRWTGNYAPEVSLIVLDPDETGDLVRATNTVSARIANVDPGCIIGNLGDDHVVRTTGWDARIAEALASPGVAYGDDRHAGERLPTAPFISAAIVLALGWYALPTCRHLYIDDAWRDIGAGLDRLHYLPDVVIEHRHPLARKALMDKGYARAWDAADQDREAYLAWRDGPMADDLARVRAAL